MPPIACAPRRWQVRTSSSVYARMNGTVIVTCDAVGQHQAARPELLDHAEDVVPAAGVERAAVVAQLVEDLLHLERGEDRLDQHGARIVPRGQAELVLGERERLAQSRASRWVSSFGR